ncbi:hypothetical protein [Xanthomonas dyei]|uniref:hypothetical protein n=1 Tax=Xanthomonas dyei TaxID=743699 RepID=UPI000E1F2323|nr:hypothetical protein [Xanthomonas dyei]
MPALRGGVAASQPSNGSAPRLVLERSMAGAAQSGVQQPQVARYITSDFRLPTSDTPAWR